MKIVFEVHFKKKDDFIEEDFLKVISKDLTQLNMVTSFKYMAIDEGYLFEVEYKNLIPGITYQPILGCFSNLEREYPYISNMTIPVERMR